MGGRDMGHARCAVQLQGLRACVSGKERQLCPIQSAHACAACAAHAAGLLPCPISPLPLQLVMGEGLSLAPALCEAVQALMARLQEQAAAASSADPLAGMPLPARCHGLLQLLLEVAWQVGGRGGWAGGWEAGLVLM